MKRVLSIWLPHWPADRLRRAQARRGSDGGLGLNKPLAKLGEHSPLAFTINAQSTQRLAAVNCAASILGLFPGMRLGDARAMLPELLALPYAPGADARDLRALALWCGRFSPWVTPEKPNAENDTGKEVLPDPLYQGLRLDISGCAHLLGGEAALAEEIGRRFRVFGFQAQIAIADGIGAAWALARFHGQAAAAPMIIEGTASLPEILAPLSVQALRLPEEMVAGLERLGLRSINDLYAIPAKGLTARFGALVNRRLNQALGRLDEPLSPDQPLEQFWSRLDFAEPIGHGDDIARASDQLVDDLCAILLRAGVGALKLCLRFFLADGSSQQIQIGCARASRDSKHLKRLLSEHLPVLEAAFGADAMTLQADRVETLAPAQMALDPKAPTAHAFSPGQAAAGDFGNPELGLLVDRLGNRLGMTNLARFLPRDSHIPEQAVQVIGPLSPAPYGHPQWYDRAPSPRPMLMLPAPEPVETMAEIPEGPPMMFRWRGNLHRVIKVDGPERIAPEWWRAKSADQGLDAAGLAGITRDYFRVEDHNGARFWLYRRGLYEKPGERQTEVISKSIVPALSVEPPELETKTEADSKPALEKKVPSPRWYLQGIFP